MSIDPLTNSTIPNIKEKRKNELKLLFGFKRQIDKQLKHKTKLRNQVLVLL